MLHHPDHTELKENRACVSVVRPGRWLPLAPTAGVLDRSKLYTSPVLGRGNILLRLGLMNARPVLFDVPVIGKPLSTVTAVLL